MKTIIDIVNEGKSGPLKKIHMLSIIIIYQMNTEFKVYDDFFSKLSDKEIKDYNYLVDKVSFYDDQNAKVQWSSLKKWFPLLLKTCEYVENSDNDKFSKADKRIWKEIKEYVG